MRRTLVAIPLSCLCLCLALPVAAQTVTATQPLAFGRFAAGAGGTVTVNAAGVRSKSGAVVLVSSGNAAAAQFSLSGGSANQAYSITLPANGAVSLTGPSGASMAVNNFVSTPAGTGTLGGGGTATLNVGATLTVGNNQQAGTYSGGFTVTIDFN